MKSSVFLLIHESGEPLCYNSLWSDPAHPIKSHGTDEPEEQEVGSTLWTNQHTHFLLSV